MSPYFFLWSKLATDKYYAGDSAQQEAQLRFLSAIESFVAVNGSARYFEGTQYKSPLDHYLLSHAGEVLMTGVCLQKQFLDPYRSTQQLEIRNGFQPFLHR